MKKFNIKREQRKLWIRQHKSSIIKYGTCIISTIILVIAVLYFSKADFSAKVTFDVIDARVAPFSSGDVQIVAFYKDGEKVNEMPKKYMYKFSNYECDNGATLTWDAAEWNMTISNVTTKTKCSLYFVKSTSLIDKIRYLATSGTISGTDEITVDGNGIGLAYDGTVDKNLRYIGSSPNNYILYNCNDYSNPTINTCELWRIIGVFNNIQTDENDITKKESLIKIVRKDSIGKYSWDSSDSSINNGGGINEWSQADLKTELNDLYYNAGNGTCYNGINNETTTCDFSSIGLKNIVTKNMIQSILWNIAPANNTSHTNQYYEIPGIHYLNERSSYYGKQCNDGLYCNDSVIRTTTWYGNIALIYPSDYLFAAGGTSRSLCLENDITGYDNNNCYTNNWFWESKRKWMLSSGSSTSHAFDVYLLNNSVGRWASSLNYNQGSISYEIYPTLFLKSSITINDENSDGSIDNPYVLVP